MRHWPKFPRPPPSLGTLGHMKLGHLACFETPSLPLKFGTYVYFFMVFRWLLTVKVQLKLSSWIIKIVQVLTKVINFPRAQFTPSCDQWESLHHSKVHKTWAKIYCNILWQGPFDPLPPTVYVPIKISKKLGLGLDPLPPFGPMSQILLFFFLKASLSHVKDCLLNKN